MIIKTDDKDEEEEENILMTVQKPRVAYLSF